MKKIKRHIEEGENILKHTSFMDNARKMVRHHHERYDGKGYPDGLKGEEIPLCSRILAITDAYDVMMSDRVYRKSLGKNLHLLN